MPNTRFADHVTDWQKVLDGFAANAADLQHLEPQRSKLEAKLAEAHALSSRQDVLRAELNQSTKNLNVAVAEGKDLASRVRSGVRSQYGIKSEKLIEFGSRPFRRRRPASALRGPAKPTDPTPTSTPAS